VVELPKHLHAAARSTGVALLPLGLLVVFATLAVYAGNVDEFGVAYPTALLVMLPYALLSAVALGLPALLLSQQARMRYESWFCALAILIWLQGNILVWNYGVLDGSRIDWGAGAWRGVLDLAIWVLLLWLASHASHRTAKMFFNGALAVLALQLVTAVITLTQQPQILHRQNVAANVSDKEAIAHFSSGKNIVHILMDGFQSDVFADILADSNTPDLRAELQGFTFFEQQLGAYPYTQLSVPAMLSGRLFHNDVPVESFISEAMSGDTIINTAIAAGYEVDIAAEVALTNIYMRGEYTNAYSISPSGHVSERDFARADAAKLLDLALFRSAPHFAKALVYRDALWVFQAGARQQDYLYMQNFADLAFLDELADDMSTDRDTPVYKMIHVMLSHRPFVANEDCEYVGRRSESREIVSAQARCGLSRVMRVLQAMKRLGIYDSSLIILMADHGAWVPIENFADTDDATAMRVAMATPTLAVKPPFADNAFTVSAAPSSIVDLPATIADLAGFDTDAFGTSVFKLSADAERERHHLVYGYGRNPRASGYLFPMQEYIVTGNPYQAAAWRKGDRYAPP